MRKKILFFILTTILIATLLAGCGNNEQVTKGVAENVVSENVETDNKTDENVVVDTESKAEDGTTSEVGSVPEAQEEINDTLEVEPETESHEHSYTGEVTKEATCDESGVMTYTCSCGDTYTEETGRMDHCVDRNEVVQEATCEEEGILAYYCIFCGREIFTETIAKFPHTESCNHDSAETEIPADPRYYTFTECIKLMYVTGTTGIYSLPHESYDPYQYIEVGTVVPVISKCDQSNFYRTPWGMTISGENLSEQRPAEYSPGGEEGWENFSEEIGERYTYWSGIYRANGFEIHCDRLNKPYVERHILYAQNGLYTVIYREVNSDYWSGCYEIVIEEGCTFAGQFMDWLKAYMDSQGIKTSTSSEETLQLYRSPKDENNKLRTISVAVPK